MACSVIYANALGYLRSATGGGESKHLDAMCADGMVFDQVSFGIRYSQPLLLPAIFCPPLLALSVVARHRPAEANLRRLAMPLSTTQAARVGGKGKRGAEADGRERNGANQASPFTMRESAGATREGPKEADSVVVCC